MLIDVGGNLIDAEEQLIELDRADCEDSLYEFLRNAWKYIDAAPWKDGWPIEAVAEHLQAVADGDIKRLVINIPPRFGKSTITSVAFPAWIWAQRHRSPTSGPGVQFLTASYANQLVLRDSVKCRRLIESPWYQALWGDRFKLNSDQNTKSRFSNDQGGERLITSVGAAVTGEGGSCFPAGTMISTPDGERPIESLLPGDEVMAFDFDKGNHRQGMKKYVSTVVATAQRLASDFVNIATVNGRKIKCTKDHLIYCQMEGVWSYVPAFRLRKGAELFDENEGIDFVSSAQHDWMYDTIVYDIQVKYTNNFFAEGILVHNCIIVDDPNAASEAFSEATIQATIDWWDGAMSTRLNDAKTGAYIVIQQRLAEDDLTGHIMSKNRGEWTHLCLPMKYESNRSFVTKIGWEDPREEEGELLWPERFGEDEVRQLERVLGPFGAAGQLQQRPEPAGGGVIKRDWWLNWEETSFPPMDFVLASLDTAYTTQTMNDASAMTVWGVFSGETVATATRMMDENGRPMYKDRSYSELAPKVMLMHAWNGRYELHELVEKVAKTAKAMKIDLLVIENKAAGFSVAQEIRRLYSNEGFAVQLYDPKSQDKLSRLYSVQHLFAEGMIYAPDRAWADMVITQVSQFPKGKHDDLVDTTSMALRKMREMGLLVRGPERIAEIESSRVYPGKCDVPLYPA